MTTRKKSKSAPRRSRVLRTPPAPPRDLLRQAQIVIPKGLDRVEAHQHQCPICGGVAAMLEPPPIESGSG